jgi:hypothetical protein
MCGLRTARKVGGEVYIEQKFGVTSDTPSVWKIRHDNILFDAFSWTADRSDDGGKTWERDFQKIEARRIGAARNLGPLAVPKQAGAREQEPAREWRGIRQYSPMTFLVAPSPLVRTGRRT